MSKGILSHKRAKKISHNSVAMEVIQERREKKNVPGGRPLQEYVNQEPIDNQSEKVKQSPERVKPAWVALVEILSRLEQELYHWPVGRTTFQKIAYISTQEGLPTGRHYQKSSFGPFSPELKGVITRLVNNGLIREEQLGRMFAVKIRPTFADAHRAYMHELAQ